MTKKIQQKLNNFFKDSTQEIFTQEVKKILDFKDCKNITHKLTEEFVNLYQTLEKNFKNPTHSYTNYHKILNQSAKACNVDLDIEQKVKNPKDFPKTTKIYLQAVDNAEYEITDILINVK